MTSYQIAEAWKDATRDSVALNDFCQAQFGKEPMLFLDVDPRDVPGKKDCPYIAFLSHGSPAGGRGSEDVEFSVSVFVGMVDNAVETNGREVSYTGRRVIEKEFNPLVVAAVETVSEFIPEGHKWEVAQLDSGFFLLENIFTVNLPNTIGLD